MITSFTIRVAPLVGGVPQVGGSHNHFQKIRIWSGLGMTVQMNSAHQHIGCCRDGCEVFYG